MSRAKKLRIIINPNPHLSDPVASFAKPKKRVKSTAPRLAKKLTKPNNVARLPGSTALEAK